MYICIPVVTYTHTHVYILVTWASGSPESQRAKKRSCWMWCLGSIREMRVCGFSVAPDAVEGNLGHPPEQTQKCISQNILRNHPVPVAAVCHPGTWAGAGGRSRAPRGTPISAVGQGNPMLQPGAWGTRHCLHATRAPTPCHGHIWKRTPCS